MIFPSKSKQQCLSCEGKSSEKGNICSVTSQFVIRKQLLTIKTYFLDWEGQVSEWISL